MNSTGMLLALTTGILGGFGHCIGMCGPLIASYAFPARREDGMWRHASAQLLFHAGRITTYSFIGLIMGLTGSFVNIAGSIAGIQNAVALIAGILMILSGLGITGIIRKAAVPERGNAFFLRASTVILDRGSFGRTFPLGLLLGFMPCGLSLSIFIGAAATGDPREGMLLTLLFGAGTVPALFLLGLVLSHLGAAVRGNLYRTGGILIILMGIMFIIRGLSSYAAM